VFSDPRPFVAIPVFPSRMFRHSCIYVNAHSGIEQPADLVGRRVGCPEYQMTAAVWLKGILADHYGVPVNSVTYHTGGLKEPGRREVAMDLPPDISVTAIPEGRTLSDMIDTGEIDALYTAEMPASFEHGSPNVRRLFPDYEREERAYFERTGMFPIMHTVVVKASLLERHPWIAQSLTKAFTAAQKIAYADLCDTTALKAMLPWLVAHVEATRQAMGADYWPYGIERNRANLDTFLRYSHEQGLSPRRLQPEELFASSTLLTSRT
jgi:4,5-dihydroxyphthalate decarboxylase